MPIEEPPDPAGAPAGPLADPPPASSGRSGEGLASVMQTLADEHRRSDGPLAPLPQEPPADAGPVAS